MTACACLHACVRFLCTQSLEEEGVRAQVLRLVSLPLWHALGAGRLQLELHALPALAKHWKNVLKKEQKVRQCGAAVERSR